MHGVDPDCACSICTLSRGRFGSQQLVHLQQDTGYALVSPSGGACHGAMVCSSYCRPDCDVVNHRHSCEQGSCGM